jgi:pimeloyl-ACP methyl ester carboxylesterase
VRRRRAHALAAVSAAHDHLSHAPGSALSARPAIVVLHGANGGSAEVEPLSAALRRFARVIAPDMLAHGGRSIPARFDTRDLAEDVMAELARQGVERPFVVGYSLGGYLALYLARHFPGQVRGACAIATKVVFDAATVQHWSHLASPARLGRPGNPRAAQLEKLHAPQDWKEVALANIRLFDELGRAPPLSPADFEALDVPVMLVNANRDPLVPWSETLELRSLVPHSALVMFYGLAHPIAHVPVESLAVRIDAWMKELA